MTFDLLEIMHKMGPFQMVVAITLLIMAVAAMSVGVERAFVLWRANRRSRAFAAVAAGPIIDRDLRGLAKRAAAAPASPLASLLGAGAQAYVDAGDSAVPPAELARRAMARRADALDGELRRGLSVLASVGSVGPFVGLLGTVV